MNRYRYLLGCWLLVVAGFGAALWFAGRSMTQTSFAINTSKLLLVFGFLTLVILTLWLLPKLQVAALRGLAGAKRFELENNARTTLAQIIGGTFLLVGLVATWTTIRDSERGQFTERFTKAVNQIGDKQLDVRLGGIFALEALAKESVQDRGSITQVLTAFVRIHAPITQDTGHRRCSSVSIDLNSAGHARAKSQSAREVWPPPDVQTVLTILAKGEITRDGPRLQLSEADLGCAYLPHADLSNFNFQQTHLEDAWLRGAHFDGAILMGTVLTNAIMENATFLDADLSGSLLHDAINVNCDNLVKAAHFLGAKLPDDCKEAIRKQADEERSFKSHSNAASVTPD